MTQVPVPKWVMYVLGRYHYFDSRQQAIEFGNENGMTGQKHIRRTTVYYEAEVEPTVTGNDTPNVSGNVS